MFDPIRLFMGMDELYHVSARPPQRSSMMGIQNDPRYQSAANAIAKEFNGNQAMAWRLEDDNTLTVVVFPGPKINRPLPKSIHIKAGIYPEKQGHAVPVDPVPVREQSSSRGPYDVEYIPDQKQEKPAAAAANRAGKVPSSGKKGK